MYVYSWFFTNFLVFMTYSGAMPIMYILGMFHFILAYLCYKYLFLTYNSITYGFDLSVPMYALRLMKWGLFLHLLFNMFMYTNKRLLTPYNFSLEDYYRPRG